MRRLYEAAVILVGTLGWWGFIYPELSMAAENYAQEAEAEQQDTEGKHQEAKAQTQEMQTDLPAGLVEELGSTGIARGNLCIKSRIAEYLYQRKEKDKAEKESGYEQPKCTHRGV